MNSTNTTQTAGAKFPLFVGIDVGGTNTKIGLVDDSGQTLAFRKLASGADGPAEDACQRMGEAVRQLVEEAGADRAQVARVGLATPGPMDVPTGMLLKPGNLTGWHDFPIRQRVSHHTGFPVTFVNDANAAAYGEYWQGAAQDYDSMVLFTLGTGIGGGIIVGDMLIDGEHGCGSECGHVVIDLADNAPRDSLNKTGSLESYCGAYAVVRRTKEALAAGRCSKLAAATEPLTPLAIAQAAEAGDELAREIVMETARYLAFGIVTMVHSIDPDGVILGGAMNFGGAGHPLGDAFLAKVRDEVRPRLLEPLRDTVAIEFASLGGDAGYIGAAGLARRKLKHEQAVSA